jgi:hypothetical protein
MTIAVPDNVSARRNRRRLATIGDSGSESVTRTRDAARMKASSWTMDCPQQYCSRIRPHALHAAHDRHRIGIGRRQ